MATISNLKHWPKGVSGNPGGQVKLPESLRNISSLSQREVCKLISMYARMTLEDLETKLKDKSMPALEAAIAAIFISSAKQGDYQKLAFLLDRAIGKAPISVEDDEAIAEREALGKLSLNELMKLVKSNLPEPTEAV